MQQVFSKYLISLAISSISIFILTGCSNKNIKPHDYRKDMHTKSYELKITPIIGSRQDDAKVIMDMGKIMKIWVAPYKDGKTFVSSHDNFVVAQAPDFVVGESVPTKKWTSMKTATDNIPFQFRDSDLDQTNKLDKEEIVKYNNSIYKQQNDTNVSLNRLEKASAYDEEIMNFLNK